MSLDIPAIKSFWNNGFDEECDKGKLIESAKGDINQLIKEIDRLESFVETLQDSHFKELQREKSENEAMKKYIGNGIEFGYIDDREGDYKKFMGE